MSPARKKVIDLYKRQSTTIAHFFQRDVAAFERVFGKAKANAETKSELFFVEELIAAYQKYGMDSYLSDRKFGILIRIANKNG